MYQELVVNFTSQEERVKQRRLHQTGIQFITTSWRQTDYIRLLGFQRYVQLCMYTHKRTINVVAMQFDIDL